MYRSDAERRLLELNLERARALAGGQRPLRHRQSARRAALHVREWAGGGFDARRRRPARPDRADADDERLHPLRRAQSLLELAAGHHLRKLLAPTILKEGPRLFHEPRLRTAVRLVGPARMSSIRCRSTGMRSPPAEFRSNLRQKPGPANSMGKMKFMFPNAQGIWLHDTPEKEKIEDAARLAEQRLRPARGCAAASRAGCSTAARRSRKGAKPEQKVNLPRRCRSTSPI